MVEVIKLISLKSQSKSIIVLVKCFFLYNNPKAIGLASLLLWFDISNELQSLISDPDFLDSNLCQLGMNSSELSSHCPILQDSLQTLSNGSIFILLGIQRSVHRKLHLKIICFQIDYMEKKIKCLFI